MPLFYLVVTIDISRDALASGYCCFFENRRLAPADCRKAKDHRFLPFSALSSSGGSSLTRRVNDLSEAAMFGLS